MLGIWSREQKFRRCFPRNYTFSTCYFSCHLITLIIIIRGVKSFIMILCPLLHVPQLSNTHLKITILIIWTSIKNSRNNWALFRSASSNEIVEWNVAHVSANWTKQTIIWIAPVEWMHLKTVELNYINTSKYTSQQIKLYFHFVK